jgi:drug/metabolite transporter (DMT)-like permease
MLWLVIALITAFLYALSSFLDNYLTDEFFKGRVPQALKIIDGPACLVIAIILVTYHGVFDVSPAAMLLCTISGVLLALADIPYYLGLRGEESTGMTILFQLSPIFYLLADYLIFGETIEPTQILAFIFILAAPFIIYLTERRYGRRGGKLKLVSAFWIIASVIIYAFSDLLFTHGEEGFDFVSLFFYFLVGQGVASALISLTQRRWHKRFANVAKRNGYKFPILFIFNLLICTATDFLYRYALIIGTAAIVSVTTNSAQLIMTFVMGIILTRLWPKFGREKLNKHIIRAHFIATILAIIGIVILQ